MLKIDMETMEKEVFIPVHANAEYKEALDKFMNTLLLRDVGKIDDSVSNLEAVIIALTYKQAFHDGMRFILNTMVGKEVIEL